jgi:hypothetical protein
MSKRILGNYIQLASHVVTLFVFRAISEEGNAIALVIGLIGELAGFVMTQYGRLRMGDPTVAGMRKSV